jgi:hypothetical protein
MTTSAAKAHLLLTAERRAISSLDFMLAPRSAASNIAEQDVEAEREKSDFNLYFVKTLK